MIRKDCTAQSLSPSTKRLRSTVAPIRSRESSVLNWDTMRAVIQRVAKASVGVEGETVSEISRGLMVLVGIGIDDTNADLKYIANKIITLKLFSDPENPSSMWKRSVKDIQGDILCVSQFTLYAKTTKGSKPDFHLAMPGGKSRPMYESFLSVLGTLYDSERIKDGKFGAMMNVSLTNEGPVTVVIDSRKVETATPIKSNDLNPDQP